MSAVLININKHSRGFTLIEVLIALAIAGIVISSLYSIFTPQTKTYANQEQIVDVQRSLRFAMSLMERDLRNLGYNPGGLTESRATSDGVDNDCDGTVDESDNDASLFVMEAEQVGLIEATESSLTFSQDLNGDGKVCGDKEMVRYSLVDMDLKRNDTPVSGNIERLNLIYLDEDGGVASRVEEIRSVQIALIGRTSDEDPAYTNTNSYINLQGTEILPAQNDGYRRRLLTTQVYMRNLDD